MNFINFNSLIIIKYQEYFINKVFIFEFIQNFIHFTFINQLMIIIFFIDFSLFIPISYFINFQEFDLLYSFMLY